MVPVVVVHIPFIRSFRIMKESHHGNPIVGALNGRVNDEHGPAVVVKLTPGLALRRMHERL
jgi:hypothetical protein